MLVWHAKGLPEPAAWLDTLPDARAAGLPGELDKIGKRLIGFGKHDGAAALRRLCKPDERGQLPPFTPDEAIRIARYNLGDVLLLKKVHTEAYGACESDVAMLDQIINERGVAFDAALAWSLIRLDEQATDEALAAVEKTTAGAIKASDLSRGRFLLGWLESQGAKLVNLQRPTIEKYLHVNPAGVGKGLPNCR
jgi:hypothetical protein